MNEIMIMIIMMIMKSDDNNKAKNDKLRNQLCQ